MGSFSVYTQECLVLEDLLMTHMTHYDEELQLAHFLWDPKFLHPQVLIHETRIYDRRITELQHYPMRSKRHYSQIPRNCHQTDHLLHRLHGLCELQSDNLEETVALLHEQRHF